jgi:hypothetical protein
MKSNFRQVYVFNLDVVAQKKDAVLPGMADLVALWERQRAAGQAKMPIEKGDVNLTLAPVLIDATAQRASLLIRHSDKYAAESVYSDIAADTFTAHAKGATEGGETGIHVFISSAPERNVPGRYTCMVERVPTITVEVVRRFLNHLIRGEYTNNPVSFEYDHPAGQRTRAGTVARVRCLPRLEFEGRPSQQLARDVQQGRLTGIVLKKSVTHTPVGGVPYLTKEEATLKVRVDQGNLSSNVWGDVRRALASEAADYPTAQIGIRLPGKTRSVSVSVDSSSGAPLTRLYVQSFDIDLISPPMAQSARTIVPQFDSRVASLLDAQRNI